MFVKENPDRKKKKSRIEQAKFPYSPLGKAFEKQIKTIKEQGKKLVEALKVLKSIKKQVGAIKPEKKKSIS